MGAHHVTIYKERGRYAGWPANYGIWGWGDEIVVGFTLGYHDPDGGFHTRDRNRPFVGMQARSLDGGERWEVVETPFNAPGNKGVSADEHMKKSLVIGDSANTDNAPRACLDGVDLENPDLALMCARTGLRAGAQSWFYASADRCRSWDGPYTLPMFDQLGIAARTDYQVTGSETCMLFLTSTKSNGEEGKVFCANMQDSGRSFEFGSWIGEEPEGFSIMPASVRLSDGRFLVSIRCRGGGRKTGDERNWIDLYETTDNCATWHLLNRPVEETGTGGNPPAMIQLKDGRIWLTYGYRDEPSGMRAKVSEDQGRTWGEEIVLRDGGGDHDLGYPRTIQREDGKIVTVYYFNDSPDSERYVAATIWDA